MRAVIVMEGGKAALAAFEIGFMADALKIFLYRGGPR
jgi:hypothetical protein